VPGLASPGTSKAEFFQIIKLVLTHCARLRVLDLSPEFGSDREIIVEVTTLLHGMTGGARNTGDFKLTNVEMLNPWEAG
jgi:hypothetical protein